MGITIRAVSLAGFLVLGVTEGVAGASDQKQALTSVALDYAMGWYTADAERMGRALHPQLAKRALLPADEAGDLALNHMDKERLVTATRNGGGASVPESERRADVEILDVYGNAAVVKLTMHGWVDYLQLVKEDDRWRIVNVLWELNPRD